MSELPEIAFGDLGELFDGPHATPKRIDNGPYFLNISSLASGRLDLSQSDHVSEGDFEKWTRRVTPQEDDLLFSYETRLGEVALMPGGIRACLGRRMALLRPDQDRIVPRFLLYYYLSPQFQELIQQRQIHGATVPRIGLATMGDWPVSIPSLDKQRAIAEVLGALDDKIAANEKLASNSMDVGELEYVLGTDGASSRRMSDVLVPVLGGTPSRSDVSLWDGTIPWVSAKDIARAQAGFVIDTDEGISEVATVPKRLRPLEAGSVVLTARGTVGAVARLSVAAAINQSCYGFVPDDVPAGCLYFLVRRSVAQAKAMVHGSVFDTITKKTFENVSVPDMTGERWSALESRVGPLVAAGEAAVTESRLLAHTRDELLPLLMSGKITVKDAEAVVSDAV